LELCRGVEVVSQVENHDRFARWAGASFGAARPSLWFLPFWIALLQHVDHKIRVTNVDTGEDATGSVYWDSQRLYLVSLVNRPGIAFECGTTYEVTVRRVKSLEGAKLSEVPAGVTLEKGTASWTFTTVACP
jgi:hypothetical protein